MPEHVFRVFPRIGQAAQSQVFGKSIERSSASNSFTHRLASDLRILDKARYVAGGAIGELTDDMVKHHLTV